MDMITLTEKNVGAEQDDVQKTNDTQTRHRVCVILLNHAKQVALLDVLKHNYHILPGGKQENNESPETALDRETLEETGCTIKETKHLGEIKEICRRLGLTQITQCFIAKVDIITQQTLTKVEHHHGMHLGWYPLAEAIEIVNNDQPNVYSGKFIKKRELAFLTEFQKSQS